MPKLLPIVKKPSKILREKSIELTAEEIGSKKIKDLCADMKKTLKEAKGIGLAAPQIGRNIRLFVACIERDFVVMINPKIIKRSLFRFWSDEGCLSVPGTYGKVKRNKNIITSYIDELGNVKKIKAQGLLSAVIQHETDHLNGILFTDKAKDLETVELD